MAICLALVLIRGVTAYVAPVYFPAWNAMALHVGYNVFMAFVFVFSFKIHAIKLLYPMFLIYFLSTLTTYLVVFAIRYLQADNDTWQSAVIIVVVHMLVFLAAYYLMVKYLRAALAELTNKGVALLLVTPVLFFIVYEVYLAVTGAVDTPGDTFWYVLTLLIILGLSTFYINVRMALSSVKVVQTESELAAKEQIYALQRSQYTQLMENAKTIKVMRHDMRHQLSVIKNLISASDVNEELNAYLEELIGGIPKTDDKTYCDNSAVSAVAFHYFSIAESEGIKIDEVLNIPEDTGNVPDMDLCVIMGNLLENALEACRYVEDGKRYITARSAISGNRLTIGVNNSFDGTSNIQGNAYMSRKSDGGKVREGVGLSSVEATCKKHGGRMEVEVAGDVWKITALVYVT